MGSARIVIILALALGLFGCVNKENYNREVLRATNFQRLLSEEEKRGAELSAEIARLKEQAAGLEAQNKTLTAQLNEARAQVVRSLEEVGRLQDDLNEARTTTAAFGALRSGIPKGSVVKPKRQVGVTSAPPVSSIEPPDRLGELQEGSVGKKKGKEPPDRLDELSKEPAYLYHDVVRGETLRSIAKRYKTDVKTLRTLNDLASNDTVKAGDHIIVRKP